MSGETRGDVSGWTTDTLRAHFEGRLDDLRTSLQERYETQTKAIDAAFVAQQTAMQTAFEAADRAVQAALQAAEKAVGKAESASEKRFDSVNEFRATLSDQATNLMPRVEAESRIASLSEKFDDVKDIVAKSTGRGTGLNDAWGYVVGAAGVLLGIYLAVKP